MKQEAHSQGKTAVLRLKKVLLNDKTVPGGLMSVLRTDLNELLTSYFELNTDDIAVDIDLDVSGKYNLRISAPVERIKPIKVI